MYVCCVERSAHELEVDEFAARPEESRVTAAEKNERINKQLQVGAMYLLVSCSSRSSVEQSSIARHC